MRRRSLIVLFAVVAALGSFIWFFERDLPSTQERAEHSKSLVRLDAESVRAISLTVDGQLTRFERSLGAESIHEWKQTAPRPFRVDSDQVGDFLERIQGLEKERTLDDVSRDQVGLDSPRAEIKIESESEEIILRLGSQIPASSNTIVEVGDGPPFHVVADSLFEDITRDPNEWRSRKALSMERARIERIEVLKPPTGVVLERTDSGFRLVAPIEDPADEDAVASLLSALVELEIEEFVDSASHDFDSSSAVRLTISETAEPVLVEVASPAAGELVSVRVDGEEFKVASDLASQLELGPVEWQSKRWSNRDVFEIDAFRLELASEEIRFERQDGEWLREDVEIEYSSVGPFLAAVVASRGTPGDPKAHQGANPEITIVLESSGDEEILRLWADGDSYLGEREGRATVIRLDVESAEDLFAKLEVLEASSETLEQSEAES